MSRGAANVGKAWVRRSALPVIIGGQRVTKCVLFGSREKSAFYISAVANRHVSNGTLH
jgi:hypothetical protein